MWRATTSASAMSSTPDARINVAAAENGGIVTPSSTKDDNYPASAVIDGDRTGSGWGNGGGWADGTPGEFPDTFEVEFSAVTLIDQISVVTVQDVWWNPVEPNESMNFSAYGIKSFELQYLHGTGWIGIPGGTVAANTKVLRKFTFPPVLAQKIRLKINAAKSAYSMLVELEAYGVPVSAPDPTPTPTPEASPSPGPTGEIAVALAEREIFIDENNNIGFGTPYPIFNDDGTTGASVGRWVAIDGKLPGASAYLGLGGTIPNPGDRVGALNFYNRAMGGVDNRTASIFSFNGATLGTGNLEFYTSPSFLGPLRRMQIAPTGEIGINHNAGVGTMLMVMGKTADATSHALGVLNGSDQPLLTVRTDGQISVGKPGQGIVLKSPNGQLCRKLTIDNSGNLVVASMPSCP